MHIVDISNHKAGFPVRRLNAGVGVIAKATEGTTYVDAYCDGFAQAAFATARPFGFYHFARQGAAAAQARFFRAMTKGYEGRAIPILDLEDTRCNNAWMEEFVREYHAITGVWPWVYMSSDFINNRGYGTAYVREHCALWIAGYPSRATTFPTSEACPYAHKGWTLAAWQFTDRLSCLGYSVDASIGYLDASAWQLYAQGDNGTSEEKSSNVTQAKRSETLEGSSFKVTIEEK